MSELQQTLHDLHRELAGVTRIEPEQRALLEAALADIQHALNVQDAAGGGANPAPDVAPADALESAAVRLEADHPGLAGAVRAFVDALTKAGI
jgi:hypothetical protein